MQQVPAHNSSVNLIAMTCRYACVMNVCLYTSFLLFLSFKVEYLYALVYQTLDLIASRR